MNWLYSQDAAGVLTATDNYPLREGAGAPAGMPSFGSVKFTYPKFDEVAVKGPQIVALWHESLG